MSLNAPLLFPNSEMDDAPRALPGMVGHSVAMQDCFRLVEHARETSATVLLSGETGTGKELLAQAIHSGSERRTGPFVAVNCAAFPDTLLESELFGHLRGAFTGAERAKQGLFQTADGGTMFLDEIGETSATLQAKLLRVLQEREVRPVGGERARRVDVRVVAATNRELQAEIKATRFRADLYYRLAVFPIRVPPLRERRADVVPLAEHFLALYGRREGRAGCTLHAESASALLAHSWPGNVRELENEMQRALALSKAGDCIFPARLSERVGVTAPPLHEVTHCGETLRETLARVETLILQRTLQRFGGRRIETARALGVTREGLYKKLRRHNLA